MKHLDISVTGKVQGVFFRASTKDRAEALGINGWVCNKADGSVYLEAEGQGEELEKLLDWLRQGPPGAHVETVSAEPGIPRNFRGFNIRH